jgi:ketosteroid isomerase-like protein
MCKHFCLEDFVSRFFRGWQVIGCVGLLAMLLVGSARSLASDNATAATGDRSWTAALAKGDKGVADKLADAEFTWTDRTGKTHTRAEALANLGGSADSNTDMDVSSMDKGKVVLFRGTHKISAQNVSVRFVRVWVQRLEGWKLMVYQETTKAEKTPEKRSGFGAPSDGAPVVCDNPCRNIPYKPEDPSEREIATMWQKVEQAVLTNDVDAWIPNFTDDFVFVTPDGGPPLNKMDRVNMIKDLKRSNTTLIPGEVVSMKVWVFGDAAVMRSEHKSHRGKTLHITRVFTKRSGHWQIAFGQQTAIE